MKTPLRLVTGLFFLMFLVLLGVAFAGEPRRGKDDSDWAEVQRRLPGEWLRGRSAAGRTLWLAGPGLAAPKGVKLPDPREESRDADRRGAASKGDDLWIDLSHLPRVTDREAVSIEVPVSPSVDPRSIRVSMDGEDVTAKLDVDQSGIRSAGAVPLDVGRTVLAISARGHDGGDTNAHFAIERVDSVGLEAMAASRSLIETAAPLLGLDLEKVELGFVALEEDLLLEHAEKKGEGDLRLARARWAPRVAGVPVDGAGLTVLLFPDPDTHRPVAGALVNGIDQLPQPGASLEGVVSPSVARRAIAKHVADDDTSIVTTPALHWVRGPEGGFVLGYVAFVSEAYAPTAVAGLPRSERVVVDGKTGALLAHADLVHFQDPLRSVIDGPPEDLDTSFVPRPMRGMEVLLTPSGPLWCANGTHSRIYNRSDSLGYHVPCLPDATLPDLFPTEDDIITPTSLDDELIDAFGAYYHVDELARVLSAEIGFDHDLPGNNFWLSPAPSYDTQMPVFVNEMGDFRDNAVAIGVLMSASVQILDTVVLAFGRGSGFGETTFGGEDWLLRAGWARERDVVYHEFGHSVLYGQGFFGGNNLKTSLHEGYADFTSHTMTGGDHTPSDWLMDSNDLPAFVQRECDVFDPSAAGFQAYPADDPDDDVGDPHIAGAAFCQALARAQQRSALIDGADPFETLGLATIASVDWSSAETQLEPVATSLIAREIMRWLVLRLFGQDTVPRDHELRTALALHGIVEDTAGRTSAISLEQGGRTLYSSASDTSFLIATGINPFATLEFSTDSDFATVCHSEEITLDSAGPNRFFEGAFDFSAMRSACLPPWLVGSDRVYVNLVSCTGDSDCRDSSAANQRELGGTPLWVDVQGFVLAPF